MSVLAVRRASRPGQDAPACIKGSSPGYMERIAGMYRDAAS